MFYETRYIFAGAVKYMASNLPENVVYMYKLFKADNLASNVAWINCVTNMAENFVYILYVYVLYTLHDYSNLTRNVLSHG